MIRGGFPKLVYVRLILDLTVLLIKSPTDASQRGWANKTFLIYKGEKKCPKKSV